MERNKVEQYLTEGGYEFQSAGENVWLLTNEDSGLAGVVIAVDHPVVIFRVDVMDCPAAKNGELFRKLLEMNAADMVYGAYAIDNGKVIIINSMEYDTMDFSEFQSVLDSFSMALSRGYPELAKYREAK
jgi:hypothetical protein